MLEHIPPFHLWEVSPLLDHLCRDALRPVRRRGRIDPKALRVLALGVETHLKNAGWILLCFHGFENDGSGPVSENHCDVTSLCGDVETGGVDFATNHHHSSALARLNQAVAEIQRVQETAALSPEIDTGNFAGTESIMQEERGPRELVLGRERGEKDKIEVLRIQLGGLKRALTGHLSQVGGGLSVDDPASLFDTGSLLNPFVGRVHPFGEIVVRDDLIRDAHTGPDDLGPQVSTHFLGSPDSSWFRSARLSIVARLPRSGPFLHPA